MEQHVGFGSFTSLPVARRGARRSPAAWLSVLPCRPQRPGDDRSNRGVVAGAASVTFPSRKAENGEIFFQKDWETISRFAHADRRPRLLGPACFAAEKHPPR